MLYIRGIWTLERGWLKAHKREMTEILEKFTKLCCVKMKIFIITHLWLTSELPWQRNGAITSFTCFWISRYQEFFRKLLKGACTSLRFPQLWQSLNDFYDSVLEIFWNEFLKALKTVSNHAIVLFVLFSRNKGTARSKRSGRAFWWNGSLWRPGNERRSRSPRGKRRKR